MSLYTEPLRYRIIVHIADILKTIRPIDGFYHDLSDDPMDGPRVHVGRKVFGEQDVPPFVSILENRERLAMESIKQRNGVTLNLFGLIIQTWADEDQNYPTRAAYRLSSEVSATLAEYDKVELPFEDEFPCIYEMKIEPALVNAADEFSDIAYSMQRLDLWLAEDLKSPYDDT